MLSFFNSGRFVALLALRLVLGIIMIAHGYPKVFGGGIHGHLQMVGSLGLPPWLGYLSASTEFFGGVLLLLGLVTRVVAIAIAIEMFIVIAKVHWHAGLTGQGGYQFPLALGVIAFALIFLGAGPISLDRLFLRDKG
jgi:putative oxidoreductase